MYMLLMHIALVRDLHTYTDPFDETQSVLKSELKCNFWGAIEVIIQLVFFSFLEHYRNS